MFVMRNARRNPEPPGPGKPQRRQPNKFLSFPKEFTPKLSETAVANVTVLKQMLNECQKTVRANTQPSTVIRGINMEKVKMTPEIRYMLAKLKRLQAKRRESDVRVCREIIGCLDPVLRRAEEALKKNVPVVIDMAGICAFQESRIRRNSKVAGIGLRIGILEKKIERSVQFVESVGVRELMRAMSEVDTECDLKLEHCSECKFDDLLRQFVPKDVVKDIASDIANRSDFTKMIEYYDRLCGELHACDKKSRIVLRNAFSRMIFDVVYLSISLLDIQSTELTLNADVIKKMSPQDLNLEPSFFPGSLMTSSLEEVYQQIPILKEGFLLLDCLTFLIDPFEMAHNLWKLTSVVKEWMCPNKRVAEMTSFETYFTAFFTLFIGHPPVNAKGISLFLKMCEPISRASTAGHSMMTFIGTVEYVEEFMTAEKPEGVQKKLDALTGK